MNNQNNIDRVYTVCIPPETKGKTLLLEIRELSKEELELQSESGEPIQCPTLGHLQKAVEGNIESLRLRLLPQPEEEGPIIDYTGWGNEEGKRLEMKFNIFASMLRGGDILGPLVITGDDGFGDAPAFTIAEVVELRDHIFEVLQAILRMINSSGLYTVGIRVPWRDPEDLIIHEITTKGIKRTKGE